MQKLLKIIKIFIPLFFKTNAESWTKNPIINKLTG